MKTSKKNVDPNFLKILKINSVIPLLITVIGFILLVLKISKV